jgi:ribulose-phosphate 3-epimerase
LNRQFIVDTLKEGAPSLSVGILSADLSALDSEIALLEAGGAPLLHLDVMDGKVWPKATVGPDFLADIETKMLKDVHLLVDKPETYLEGFAKAGADIIAFSVEYCADIGAALQQIGQFKNANDPSRGILRGVSLNPDTPVARIETSIEDVDIVVLLAVGPDTGKQDFIAELPDRIAAVKALKEDVVIFVDGGIKKDNVAHVASFGPDVIVTGSAVFDGVDAKGNLAFMTETIDG